jgi:hypothetical protein
MKRWERNVFNLLALLVTVTGVGYFWMKYALTNPDPFAVVNHPWQGTLLALHVIVSPVFILVFGIVLNSHVMKMLRAPRVPNGPSGLTSLATFAAMVLSGYLLQVSTNEAWLQALVVLHVASGAVFSVAYTLHLVIGTRLSRSRQNVPIREVA